ncbi:MAG: prepilin-type N-terminal cleavage/methylation domain-containing protein [Candidatus Pacearchaeota archaeon]
MYTFKKAFTLIELLVVVAIIGILAGLIIMFMPKGAYASDCGGWWQPSCTSNASESNKDQIKQLWLNQAKLVQAVPVPTMETSLERSNIAKRAETFNKENKISYIYLVSYGKVMAFYTVKGKVSSTNSYLIPQEQLVDSKGRNCGEWNSGIECYVVQAPDIDGSYGDNSGAIFFFTTEGVYVEWNGEYMLADQPLTLTTAPELVRSIK